MKSTSRTSVRRLASGSYIVSGVRSRSAITGRYVTKSETTASPRSAASDSSDKTSKSSSK
ncbi:hypothetical protein GCM10027586_00360 [Kineococcus gypseus]